MRGTTDVGIDRRQLWVLLQPYIKLLVLCSLLIAAVSVVGLMGPQLAGSLVDAAAVHKDLNLLSDNFTRLVGLFALLGLMTYAHTRIVRSISAKLLCDLRQRVFDRLVSLSPGLLEQRSTGEVLSRLNSDVGKIQQILAERFPHGLQSALTFMGTLLVLFFMHTRLTLFTLILTPLIAMAASWSGRRLERLSMESLDAVAAANARAQEAISGLRTVQAFGQEGYERGRFADCMRQVLQREFRIGHYAGAFSGIMQFVGFGAFALVLAYGGQLIANGELSPGELTSFLLYTLGLTVAVVEMGDVFMAYKELQGCSRNVLGALTVSDSIVDAPNAVALTMPQGGIELVDVTFAYPGADGASTPAILHGVSVSIPPGENVALVGANGAGKTTLFSLLLRYYDPQSGSIRVDGQDVRTVKLKSLRSALAVVSQQVFLFSGSIAENIRYGSPEATQQQIEAAAKASGAHRFIRLLEQGYATQVGELGQRLSGGQRQQIAIARAFLRDAPILLFDEATNSLDPITENLIQEAVARLARGRTTIAIAHRLATAQRADRVLFLAGGRLAAAGPHQVLYADNIAYREHWQRQLGVEESMRGTVITGTGTLSVAGG